MAASAPGQAVSREYTTASKDEKLFSPAPTTLSDLKEEPKLSPDFDITKYLREQAPQLIPMIEALIVQKLKEQPKKEEVKVETAVVSPGQVGQKNMKDIPMVL